MKESAIFQVIRNRHFQILWGNQIILQLAVGVLNFSIILLLRHLTGSNTIIAIFVMSVLLPTVVFGALAGVVADVMDRRKIIVFSELLLVLTVMAYLEAQSKVGLILLCSFVFNSIAQFYIPAERASIPMLVARHRLLTANSLFSFTLYGMQFLGFSLAGPLVLKLGFDDLFIMVAVLILTGLSLVRFLPPLVPNSKTDGVGEVVKLQMIKRFKEGLHFILSSKQVLAALLILAALQGVVGTLVVLATGYVEETLRIRAIDASSYFLAIPLGLGAALGSLGIGHFGYKFTRRGLIRTGAIIAGLTIILMAILPVMVTSIVGSTFLTGPVRAFTHLTVLPIAGMVGILWLWLGLAGVMVLVPAQTVLSEHTPLAVQGRIFSTLTIFVSIMAFGPIILAGWLADVVGIVKVLLSLGIFVLLAGVSLFLVPLFNKRFKVHQI